MASSSESELRGAGATHGAARTLEVSGLTTRFFTREGIVRAVEDVSFVVDRGETLGVVGESGCGKSITGLSIMRLVPEPHGRIVAGEIRLDGESLLALSEREMGDIRGRRVAMIFQDPMTSLNPVLTIGRQITEILERHLGLSGAAARRRAAELLELVGLSEAERRLDQYPHHLSGGMRQRVVIAMAIACDPEVIIADEPTTALDVTVQAQILDLLRELQQRRGTGIMMITHSMGVVAEIASRVQVMYAGSVVEAATTKAIFARPRHPYTVGLMRSMPVLERRQQKRLRPIPGLPPSLVDLPPGCPFAPRCDYAREQCRVVRPPLMEITSEHSSACWFWEEVSMHPPAILPQAGPA